MRVLMKNEIVFKIIVLIIGIFLVFFSLRAMITKDFEKLNISQSPYVHQFMLGLFMIIWGLNKLF